MVAGAPQLPRHLRVPCFLEWVGNSVRADPPRTLVSSDAGVFGASSVWLLVWFLEGVINGVAGPLSCCDCGMRLLPCVPGGDDLAATPCVVHFLRCGAVANGDLGCPTPVVCTSFSGGWVWLVGCDLCRLRPSRLVCCWLSRCRGFR